MSRPQPVRYGPFIGGINIASDPSTIDDNELVDCVNMSLDLDGSLLARPPIAELTTVANLSTKQETAYIGNAQLNNKNYVFYYEQNELGAATTYAYDGTTAVAIASYRFSAALQFNDLVFFLPVATGQGGFWNGSTFTVDANIPISSAGVFYKNRLWVVPGLEVINDPKAHQLRFTDPIDPTTFTALVWTATNLIPVAPGNGQNLMDIIVYNDNLMLFKQDSTYMFVYDANPTLGTLKQINDNIGASRRRCVASYENSAFVFHEGKVFEIINYNFEAINEKVPFAYSTSVPTATSPFSAGLENTTFKYSIFLCVFGFKLIVRFYSNVYVYELRTKTWSRWETAYAGRAVTLGFFGPLVAMPTLDPRGDSLQYYGGSSLDLAQRFRIVDGYDGFTREEVKSSADAGFYSISCYVKTKMYGEPSFSFKRLLWWGVDVISANTVVGTVTPVAKAALGTQATWSSLSAKLWSDLANATWDNPLSNTITVPSVITDTVADSTAVTRKFIKFIKALRYRLVYYTTTLTYSGDTFDGPPRFLTITAVVGDKQLVPKKVN